MRYWHSIDPWLPKVQSQFLMDRSFPLLDWLSKCTHCRDTARNFRCCSERCNWFWFGSLACDLWECEGSYKKNAESYPIRALNSTWSSMLVSSKTLYFLFCHFSNTAMHPFAWCICNCWIKRWHLNLCTGHPWIRDHGVAPDRPLDPAVLSRIKQFSAMNKLKKMALRVSAVLLGMICMNFDSQIQKIVNIPYLTLCYI